MAVLTWLQAPMNATKSAQLLMKAFNYEERGMRVLTIKPKVDTRDGEYIKSRALQISRKVDIVVDKDESLIEKFVEVGDIFRSDKRLGAVLIDESQFLTRAQVDELGEIVDVFDIPVYAYGLRTDAFSNVFEGSQRLFEIYDVMEEFTTICPCCGGKAIFNMRIDEESGKPVFNGDQESPGNNYLSVCRKYYKELKEQYGEHQR